MKKRDCARPWLRTEENSRCGDRDDRCHFPYRDIARKGFVKDTEDAANLSRAARNKTNDREIGGMTLRSTRCGKIEDRGTRMRLVTVTRDSLLFSLLRCSFACKLIVITSE